MSVRYFSLRCAEFLILFFFCRTYLFGNLLHPILLSFTREVADPFIAIFLFLRLYKYMHKYMSRLLINKTNNTVKALKWLPLFLAKLHKHDFSCFLLVQNSSMANSPMKSKCCQYAQEKQRFFLFSIIYLFVVFGRDYSLMLLTLLILLILRIL